jgi:hypothetical protein
VEYFISYYDYYQPEAYIAHTDTYIEKDSSINDEIERLRHSATSSLFERRDVIVVASVSCIYGLGDPIDYKNMVISLRTGIEYPQEELMKKLISIRYERNDVEFARNNFRVRGDTVEIYPAYWAGRAIRVEFFGDEVDRISEINAVTGIPEIVSIFNKLFENAETQRVMFPIIFRPAEPVDHPAHIFLRRGIVFISVIKSDQHPVRNFNRGRNIRFPYQLLIVCIIPPALVCNSTQIKHVAQASQLAGSVRPAASRFQCFKFPFKILPVTQGSEFTL